MIDIFEVSQSYYQIDNILNYFAARYFFLCNKYLKYVYLNRIHLKCAFHKNGIIFFCNLYSCAKLSLT